MKILNLALAPLLGSVTILGANSITEQNPMYWYNGSFDYVGKVVYTTPENSIKQVYNVENITRFSSDDWTGYGPGECSMFIDGNEGHFIIPVGKSIQNKNEMTVGNNTYEPGEIKIYDTVSEFPKTAFNMEHYYNLSLNSTIYAESFEYTGQVVLSANGVVHMHCNITDPFMVNPEDWIGYNEDNNFLVVNDDIAYMSYVNDGFVQYFANNNEVTYNNITYPPGAVIVHQFKNFIPHTEYNNTYVF